MKAKLISSKENPAFKALLRLAAAGWESREILVEGEKLIVEALRAGWSPRSAWTDGGGQQFAPPCPLYQVPAKLYHRLSPTKSGRSPLCVFPLARPATATAKRLGTGRFLLLDRIQEPGNAGALIRAATAFGMDGVLWVKPSVFPFHHAVIRASAGSVFQLEQLVCEDDQLGLSAVPLIGADMEGAVSLERFQWPEHFILALGHEGRGLSDSLRARLHARVRIPTTGMVESLNVAGAAHILLYSFFREYLPSPEK